jgi:hypothetical protein
LEIKRSFFSEENFRFTDQIFTQMKNIFFPFFISLLITACGNEPSQNAETTNSTDTPPANTTSERVIYENCAVYALATEFIFKNMQGEQLLVQVANSPGERTTKIPDNLVAPVAEGQEGPPGANPALVGKAFFLIKNEKGEIIEIKPGE